MFRIFLISEQELCEWLGNFNLKEAVYKVTSSCKINWGNVLFIKYLAKVKPAKCFSEKRRPLAVCSSLLFRFFLGQDFSFRLVSDQIYLIRNLSIMTTKVSTYSEYLYFYKRCKKEIK